MAKQNLLSNTGIGRKKKSWFYFFIYFLQFINNLLYLFIYGFEQRQKKI